MTFEESFGYLCMETQTSGNEVFSFEDLENYCHDVWNAAVEETKRKCADAVCKACPGVPISDEIECYEKPPGCDAYRAIMEVK